MGCVLLVCFEQAVDDVACNGFRGAPEEQGRGIQDQIVAEGVISGVDEEFFSVHATVRKDVHREGAVAGFESSGDSTGGRAHGDAEILYFG